mgnify:FL=1
MTGNQSKGKVREWIREALVDVESVSLPHLTDVIMAKILEEKEVLTGYLRSGVYQEVKLVVSTTRGMVEMGEEAVSRECLAERGQHFRERWVDWFEHVAGKGHVRLMAMTKGDLLIAASERRERAMTEIDVVNLWEAIA